MLIAFLEKVLESVETRILLILNKLKKWWLNFEMESFTRLLEQYIKPEQLKYDQAMVSKNDMFNSRQQMAISAGVDSMRVQMVWEPN